MTKPYFRSEARLLYRAVGIVLALSFCATHAEEAPPPLLHAIFQDHAVLQRDAPIRVWGHVKPGEALKVAFAGNNTDSKADRDGRWEALLPPLHAGGPYTLTVTAAGGAKQTISDVLVGEVWLCSGQSNMVLQVKRTLDSRAEMADAHNDRIRMLTVAEANSPTPQETFAKPSPWLSTTPENIPEFSAACFYFARELQKKIDVPMGLINVSWGGARIEAWISASALRALGGFDETLAVLALYARDPLAGRRALGRNLGGVVACASGRRCGRRTVESRETGGNRLALGAARTRRLPAMGRARHRRLQRHDVVSHRRETDRGAGGAESSARHRLGRRSRRDLGQRSSRRQQLRWRAARLPAAERTAARGRQPARRQRAQHVQGRRHRRAGVDAQSAPCRWIERGARWRLAVPRRATRIWFSAGRPMVDRLRCDDAVQRHARAGRPLRRARRRLVSGRIEHGRPVELSRAAAHVAQGSARALRRGPADVRRPARGLRPGIDESRRKRLGGLARGATARGRRGRAQRARSDDRHRRPLRRPPGEQAGTRSQARACGAAPDLWRRLHCRRRAPCRRARVATATPSSWRSAT